MFGLRGGARPANDARGVSPGERPRWGRAGGRPLVIGHRGASARAPENTLAAFALARREGADGVELDVMRCGSGELVVFHDWDLERLGQRPGKVARLPLEALREVDLGGGERIPLLSEVLEQLGPDMLVNVELKVRGSGVGGELAAPVVGTLRRHAMGARALVSSFHPLELARVRALAPDVLTGYLFHAEQALPLRRAWPACWLRLAAMHPDRQLVSEPAVARWHRRGMAVNVWTVDEPGPLRAFAAMGVDGLITNDPAGARAALA